MVFLIKSARNYPHGQFHCDRGTMSIETIYVYSNESSVV